MKTFNTIGLGLAFAFILGSEPALAQIYSWKDPATGQSKFSSVAPPWYTRKETVKGPRVIATIGERVIDDTALPYEERLLLSGKPKDSVTVLRPRKQQEVTATQGSNRRETKDNKGS